MSLWFSNAVPMTGCVARRGNAAEIRNVNTELFCRPAPRTKGTKLLAFLYLDIVSIDLMAYEE